MRSQDRIYPRPSIIGELEVSFRGRLRSTVALLTLNRHSIALVVIRVRENALRAKSYGNTRRSPVFVESNVMPSNRGAWELESSHRFRFC